MRSDALQALVVLVSVLLEVQRQVQDGLAERLFGAGGTEVQPVRAKLRGERLGLRAKRRGRRGA